MSACKNITQQKSFTITQLKGNKKTLLDLFEMF
jgi:hypothetical protein